MKKKKSKFSQALRKWDEGSFDLTDALPEEQIAAPLPEQPYDWQLERPVVRLEQGEISMYRRLYPIFATVLATVMILFLFAAMIALPHTGSTQTPTLNELTDRYVADGMRETGAVNVVAGVILDYRAFDTLGESHVLYSAAIAVLMLLLSLGGVSMEPDPRERLITETDPILRSTAKLIVPLLVVFGVYNICNGHLGPGGGFSGGAIIGAGLILYSLAFGFERLERLLNFKSYRVIVVVALCFYSLAKCYSFYCGANHLESFISPGTPGRIFSAGLILPLNIAVGAVVACTMYGFYSVFKRGRI